MDVREYLREELLEEAELGYLDAPELARRLALFDQATPRSSAAPMKAEVPNAASPLSVPENDSSVIGEDRTIDTPVGPLDLYVVRPAEATGPLPGLIVIHENKGLVPHIRDVARRLAKLGYVVVAPDLLTPVGGAGSFADDAERIAALGTLDREGMVTQLIAATDELASLDGVDSNRLGAIGFCFGGGMTWMLAARDSRIKAAVPFYGPIPPLDLVPTINAAVLGIYGALDERITAQGEEIEKAMAAAGKHFEKEVYPDAQHAFHNDTNPERYNAEAAAKAWQRATEFLAAHLK